MEWVVNNPTLRYKRVQTVQVRVYLLLLLLHYYYYYFTIKVNVKKQRRFDRSTVIFKLKSKNVLYALKYTIDYKNANEILTKTLKYLHRNNISKFFGMNKETLSK